MSSIPCLPAAATLRAIRCDSASRTNTVADLCNSIAGLEAELTALYAGSNGMTCAQEAAYLERTDPTSRALHAEQSRLLIALAGRPIKTSDAAAEIARLALLMTEVDGCGLHMPDNVDRLYFHIATFVSANASACR